MRSILLLLALIPLAGCGERPATAAPVVQEEAAKPQFDPLDTAWLSHSPLKDIMRGMWVDCGVILSVAAPGGTQIDHERVECAAEAIHRKATHIRSLWQAVLESSDACEASAKQGEWDYAWQHHTRIWKRCCDCHVATWTPERRGISAANIDAWRQGALKGAPAIPDGGLRSNEQGPADPPVRKMMQQLNTQTTAMRDALDAESAEKLAAPAAEVRRIISGHIAAWTAIADNARKLQKLAQGKASEDGRDLYNAMTGQCSQCHATSVTTPRDFLSPPVWK
jgi:hypothetical protein